MATEPIKQLSLLAVEVSALSALGEAHADADAMRFITDVAKMFQELLDHLAEDDQVMAGDMPWWTDWKSRGDN